MFISDYPISRFSMRRDHLVLLLFVFINIIPFAILVTTDGWSGLRGWPVFDCPQNGSACPNPFYICSYEGFSAAQYNIQCHTTKDWCERDPYICAERIIQPGSSLGPEPSTTRKTIPYIFIITSIALLAYMNRELLRRIRTR